MLTEYFQFFLTCLIAGGNLAIGLRSVRRGHWILASFAFAFAIGCVFAAGDRWP
jgi:hypothetical protein